MGDPAVLTLGATSSAVSTGYKLEQRDFSAGSCTVAGTLHAENPTADLEQSPYYAGYFYWNWTGGYNSTYFDPFPIVLSAPDPSGFPSLGDGTNQYVYDARQPDGYLAVPASTNAVGASTVDTTWARPHVALSVSPAMQTGAQPFQWLNSGSEMYVYTPGSYPDDQTSYPSAAFIYKGLPPNNSYFGNHVMTMTVDGTSSHIANYQLFFNATANNYPGAYYGSDGPGPIYSGIPNWYFYYNQVYQSTGSYKSGNVSSYDPASNQIYIGDNGHGSWSMRVFDLDTQNHVHYSGVLHIGGIHTFIYCCGHESGHQNDVLSGVEVSSSTLAHPDNDLGNGTGDDLDDNWESRNGFNPHNTDTTGAYQNEPQSSPDYNKGDRECAADIQALSALLATSPSGPNKNLWKQDWANDGLQYGAWNQKAYWPWYFVLNSTGSQSADPPNTSISSLAKLPGSGL